MSMRNIIERIEEAAQKSPIVVVDLKGTAAKNVVLAVSQADLAIIPIQGSQLDAEQASRAIKVIKQREKMTGRALPYAVLLARTNPVIRTRTMSHIQKDLIEVGLPVMETELNDREAFRAVFSFRQTLAGLDAKEVANLDKAQANVEDLALEILRGLSSTSATVQQGEVA